MRPGRASLRTRAGLVCGLLLLVTAAVAADAPREATVDGKYSGLLQVVNCPSHAKTWGHFKDYGYWEGGDWCGQTGKAGYWVWVNPSWYVWAEQR